MHNNIKSCQILSRHNESKTDAASYLFIKQESCQANRRLPQQKPNESTFKLSSPNVFNHVISECKLKSKSNSDVSNGHFPLPEDHHVKQSGIRVCQSTDDEVLAVSNDGGSISLIPTDQSNKNEQAINLTSANLSESDQTVSTDWLKSLPVSIKKNNHDNCHTQGFPSCHTLNDGEEAWMPKTVWANKNCKPVTIPIALADVRNSDRPQRLTSQHRDCLKKNINTTPSLFLGSNFGGNLHTATTATSCYTNSLFSKNEKKASTSNSKQTPLSGDCCNKESSKSYSLENQQKQPIKYIDVTPRKPVSAPKFTVHVRNSPRQTIASFGDRCERISPSSSKELNIHHVRVKLDESSEPKKCRSPTPSFASISSILQLVNRSVQNAMNQNNNIEDSLPAKRKLEPTDTQNPPEYAMNQNNIEDSLPAKRKLEPTNIQNPPKYIQISLPNPDGDDRRRNVQNSSDSSSCAVNTIGETSRIRPSITVADSSMTPVHPAHLNSPSNSNVACSTSLQQGIHLKRVDNTGEAKIKRPMNAFMVWAKEHRPILANVFNGLTNSQISVKLGELWNALPKVQKQRYYDQADIIKRQHKRDFPGWIYQPRPAKKRRESKYSLENLFPSEEAMNEHIMSMDSSKSLASFRATNQSGISSTSETSSQTNKDKDMNETPDKNTVSGVKSQKFVLEPIQVNPDNPKEFTCMMKPIEESSINQSPQLVHVMPILKTSSEATGAADDKRIRVKHDELPTTAENVINDAYGVMWSPMKSTTGNKHHNRLRYPVRRLHLDFKSQVIGSNIDDQDELDYEKIQQFCLESGINLEEVHLKERSNSETSVELDRIFYQMTKNNDVDHFQGCGPELLSGPEIEITNM